METIYLNEIPEVLYKVLDYSKIHVVVNNKNFQVKSIYKLGSQYRMYLNSIDCKEFTSVKEVIAGGEYRFDEERASNLLLNIY